MRPFLAFVWVLQLALPCLAENFALTFDGTRRAAQVQNPMADAGSSFTWEAWVQPGEPPLRAHVFFHHASYSEKALFIAGTQPGSLQVLLHFLAEAEGGGHPETEVIATVAFTPGAWLHVAGSYDGIQMKVFVNGELAAAESAPQYNGHLDWTNDYFGTYIGGNLREDDGDGPFFRGAIDEVRAWSVARTEQEIQESMHRHVLGPEEGLLGSWSFDEGAGQSIADASGDRRDGLLGLTEASEPSDPAWIRSTAPINYIEVANIQPVRCPTGGAAVTVTGRRFMTPDVTVVKLDGVVIHPSTFEDTVLSFDASPHVDGEVALEITNPVGYLSLPFVYRSDFLRGEANEDGSINIVDAVAILTHLFGSLATDCDDALDVNDDGSLDISDAIGLLGYLFLGTNRPPEPFLQAGVDPTVDPLRCLR